MYQITFSDQSSAEFNKLDPLAKLQFIDQLSQYCEECAKKNFENVKKFRRDNRDLFRCRVGERRVYFEFKGSDIVLCTYILHQHTLSDFLYRNKLPVSEEQMCEQYDSFWKYLESLKKSEKTSSKEPTNSSSDR